MVAPSWLLVSLACRGTVTPDTPDEVDEVDEVDTDRPPSTSLPGEHVPWERDEEQGTGTVTFTELAYHPLEGEPEWVELHNPLSLDVDLSGWSLQGGLDFTFDEGTVLSAGGYLVVASEPGALGAFDGTLDNSGERIELVSSAGRLIDTLRYGDDEPWPVHPDGSGVTLSKRVPTSASDRAEHWRGSRQLGGTPGEPNGLDPSEPPVVEVLVPEDATWRYETALVDGWDDPELDDSAWASGQAPFYAGGSDEAVEATAWATADNYFALYLGQADGGDLRLVGEDSDGSWYSVEELAFEVEPGDHLYVAAWELTGDSGSPQMVIAELEAGDEVLGTDSAGFEWVLGPSGANPGGLPENAPPDAEAVAALVADAAWDAVAVEASRGTSPWGSSVGGSFTDAASFVWGDTFDNDSLTNSEDTYALFRSVDPVLGPGGNQELDSVPEVAVFRTDFDFAGDPATATLTLSCTVDDGVVVSLNGTEVLAANATGFVADEAVDELLVHEEISSAPLVVGENVLAVALVQAEDEEQDLAFSCALSAETSADDVPGVLLSEVADGWVELVNVGELDEELDGLLLASSEGAELELGGSLAPGGLVVVELEADPGDRLFLWDGDTLLDAVRVADRPRARLGDDWAYPSEETPGTDNAFELSEDVVLHEVMYHLAPVSRTDEPFAERYEEWIELFNRSDADIDLSGWQLVDAVAYELPESTVIEAGGYLVLSGDDWEGSLDNATDRIVLLDAVGNVADDVRYFDGGRWPAAADGGGSSLELRDPWADNAAAEAWAASDESARSAWTSVSFRGIAEPSALGPDGQWEELVLGLLDAGEVLIDDLSVVRDPDTDPVEVVQDGSFDDGGTSWRLLGNHRHSQVVPDPDDGSNPVLRLVATGATGHMHNHAETTLAEDIGEHLYEISFRARWVSGSNQLLSRLYFHRLPTTTLVDQPDESGTPGAANSVAEDNIGPTFADFGQDVAVPAPGEPVVVSVAVDDPDGLEAVTLYTSVDGGDWAGTSMEDEDGVWTAALDGEDAGAVVQLYVEATDGLGATATFPADGSASRALYAVDELEVTEGLHSLRILMTEEDADWLHEDVNLMSNDRLGATVVWDEREVFYDVGVRLKGSQRGRPTAARVGYAVRFRDDQPFRGSLTSVMIDRSEGVGYGQREVLLNLVMTRAGSVSGEHNDVIHLVAPHATYDGGAELQLDRFSDLVLASQFEDGAAGTRFEYELVYYPYTTDDGTAEGLKLPQPDSVVGTNITDLGDDPEAWRWAFLIKNQERRDDYSGVVGLGQAFALGDEAFLEVVDEVIDVDQWLRAFAFMTLSGATDQYGAGSQHNVQLYVRPSDGRVLLFPHDLDYFSSSSMSVVGSSDLSRLLQEPAYARAYYGHLEEILGRAYSSDYLGPWCEQLGELLPGQDFDSHCDFVDDRAAWVGSGSSQSVDATFPWVPFAITTNGGDDFSVAGSEVVLEGTAWIDVWAITVDGTALELEWVDGQTWLATVDLTAGKNELVVVGVDRDGIEVDRDEVVVTVE